MDLVMMKTINNFLVNVVQKIAVVILLEKSQDGELIKNETEIVVVNDYNVLIKYFKFSKSVFIGKSIIKNLKKVGGQNPIEAAKLGCKIYHGPFVYNFEEIYEILKNNNISQEIINPENFSKDLFNDFNNFEKNFEKSSNLLNDLGSQTLEITINNINRFLKDESIKT